MSLNKTNIEQVRNLIASKLEEISTETGMQITLGNCSYTSENATFKLEVATLSEDGEAMTKEAKDFKTHATMGWANTEAGEVKPEWLFQTFTDSRNEEYKVVGYKPRSKKYPMLVASTSNGKKYKMTTQTIIRGFTKQTA